MVGSSSRVTSARLYGMSGMRRLSRPSSMTIYVAMWPLPLTSFHTSLSADPQTWQVFCGGYCSLLHAPQCCSTSRFALTASQNGLLNSSATGITLGIVLLHAKYDHNGGHYR